MRLMAATALVGLLAAGHAHAQDLKPAGGPVLRFPLACQVGRSCEVENYVDRAAGGAPFLDYHCGRRTYPNHTGTDIRVMDLKAQQAGVVVLAAAPGKVLRLRDGVPDQILWDMATPHDDKIGCGNAVVLDHGEGWITAYCHMARGSVRVKVGQTVAAGEPLGKVGLSGDTQFPHLHIEVRHNGQVVDPFAPAPVTAGACAPQKAMWDPAAARQLAYKRGAILNAGFAGGPIGERSVEEGGLAPARSDSPVISVYMRAVQLEAGDVIELTFATPQGKPTVVRLPPLPTNKAQPLMALSRKRPEGGWPPGRYVAEFRVLRGGAPVLQRRVEARL